MLGKKAEKKEKEDEQDDPIEQSLIKRVQAGQITEVVPDKS